MKIMFLTPCVAFGGNTQLMTYKTTEGFKSTASGCMQIDTASFDPKNCGRKNFALVDFAKRQLIADIICVIDDDVLADHTYIAKALILRFQDPSLGIVSGLRQYALHHNIPAATRIVWQEFATPLMRIAKIPWGGCLAFRKQLLPDVLEHWSKSLFDDTGMSKLARAAEWKFQHAPELTLKDTGPAAPSWAQVWEFTVRQLVNVRLQGNWPAVWATWCALVIATVAAYGLLPPLLLLFIYFTVGFNLRLGWRGIPAVLAAQALHLLSVPAAQFARKVEWCGVTYNLADFERRKCRNASAKAQR